MAESQFHIWSVIKVQNAHFHKFLQRFNRPALCNIGVQCTVQTPSKTDASTDPNLSRSCQPLRDTTRAIRDASGCPRSEDINSKENCEINMSNMSGGRWNSPAQNADAFMSANGASCCQAVSHNSHRWRKQGISLFHPLDHDHIRVRIIFSQQYIQIPYNFCFSKRAVYFLSLFYCPDPLLSHSLALLPFCNQCYVTSTPETRKSAKIRFSRYRPLSL